MSLETENREPSRYLNGEGCHAESPNSQVGPLTLGGVSEGVGEVWPRIVSVVTRL